MSIDGKTLARAKAALAEKRKQHGEIYEQRLIDVYAKAPRARALDREIMETMSELIGVVMSPGAESKIESIRVRNLELQEEKRSELLRAGFDGNYLDGDFMCPKCRDTGYIGIKMCSCLLELYKEEQRKSLSSLLKLGEETFDSFDLSYYDDTPAPDTGISPRRSMEIIYETCVEYARKFSGKSMNLFFIGSPGLGKTFLSACIARVVADNGFSVVYDMVTSVFSKFEDVKFNKVDDLEEARGEVKRYLECDLLILDDVGTEMRTEYTVSALYEIINTRLVNGRKTIVSSNLTLHELRQRYTEQIASRLEGEYQVLTFRGDDVRRKRNAV